MRRLRCLIVLVLATLGGVRCSDSPWGPRAPAEPNTMPELIVSEALALPTVTSASSPASAVALSYVSLPPGTISSAVSVRIRNLTTGGEATAPEPIVDGGFDPVAVPASAGDRLALAFTDGSGGVREEYGTVPARRPPVVVRTAPPKGRTDVALSVRPVVVFSEPIDPATLPVGMRLVTGGTLVSGRVELLAPWVAEFVPASPLQAGRGYRLEISQEVRGLGGGDLQAPVTAEFTTALLPIPPGFGAVRFSVQTTGPVSESTRFSAIHAHYGAWDYNIGDWSSLGGVSPNGTLIARIPVSSGTGGDPYFYRFSLADIPVRCSAQAPTETNPNEPLTLSDGDTLDVEFSVACF